MKNLSQNTYKQDSRSKLQLFLLMSMAFIYLIFCSACYGGSNNPISATDLGPQSGLTTTGPYYFNDLFPLFKTNCSSCHNSVSSIPNWLDYNVAYEKRN